jgi:hypothetical protein
MTYFSSIQDFWDSQGAEVIEVRTNGRQKSIKLKYDNSLQAIHGKKRKGKEDKIKKRS